MDINYYKKYEPIFGAWHITRLIGEGGFGQVYEIERKEFGTTYKAALKTITIPRNQSEVKSIMADGMSPKDVTAYYEGVVSDIVREFQLMSHLKGNSNIVSYEDHQLLKHEDGIGWDILIRMELLTPLFDYIRIHEMSKDDVIKMGIDLCKSLELCQKYNIIHRDVKPENIFISSMGDYKLGDFGIARTAEKTMSGMSRKGTFLYMAPEVYLGKAYGHTVDIYSLGLVMYRMLNDNRAPFMPAYPAPITHTDRENSLVKRISGIPVPPPVNADGKLAEIILKACAFDPEKRYHSAAEMRKELETLLYSVKGAVKDSQNKKETFAKPVNYVEDDEENATVLLEEFQEEVVTENATVLLEDIQIEKENTSEKAGVVNPATASLNQRYVKPGKNKKRNKTPGIIAIAVIVIGLFAILLTMPRGIEEIDGIDKNVTLNLYDILCPAYQILPEKYSDTPLEFKVSDESVISVNEKGEIKAEGIGTAQLTIIAGEYSEIATVTVTEKDKEITNVDSAPTEPYKPSYNSNSSNKSDSSSKSSGSSSSSSSTDNPDSNSNSDGNSDDTEIVLW